MGRSPCCDENGLKKGPWTPEEDQKLVQHIQKHGHGSWRALPKLAGLKISTLIHLWLYIICCSNYIVLLLCSVSPHSSIFLAIFAGLNRCGKSCRLRWTNYLRPDIKRGKFSQEEEQTILHLHSILGNKYFPYHNSFLITNKIYMHFFCYFWCSYIITIEVSSR